MINAETWITSTSSFFKSRQRKMSISSLFNSLTFLLQKHFITLLLFQMILCIVAALIIFFFHLHSAAIICIASIINDFHMTSDVYFDNRSWNAFCDCLVVDFAMMMIERLMIERWWVSAESSLRKWKNEINDEWINATAEKKWSFIINMLFFPCSVWGCISSTMNDACLRG